MTTKSKVTKSKTSKKKVIKLDTITSTFTYNNKVLTPTSSKIDPKHVERISKLIDLEETYDKYEVDGFIFYLRNSDLKEPVLKKNVQTYSIFSNKSSTEGEHLNTTVVILKDTNSEGDTFTKVPYVTSYFGWRGIRVADLYLENVNSTGTIYSNAVIQFKEPVKLRNSVFNDVLFRNVLLKGDSDLSAKVTGSRVIDTKIHLNNFTDLSSFMRDGSSLGIVNSYLNDNSFNVNSGWKANLRFKNVCITRTSFNVKDGLVIRNNVIDMFCLEFDNPIIATNKYEFDVLTIDTGTSLRVGLLIASAGYGNDILIKPIAHHINLPMAKTVGGETKGLVEMEDHYLEADIKTTGVTTKLSVPTLDELNINDYNNPLFKEALTNYFKGILNDHFSLRLNTPILNEHSLSIYLDRVINRLVTLDKLRALDSLSYTLEQVKKPFYPEELNDEHEDYIPF